MTFSQEIINVLNYLGQKFGIAIDWTSENVIPYLQDLGARYIRYEVFTSIAWMVAIPVITLIIGIIVAILHKKAKADDWCDECTATFAIIFWIVFAVMSFASICVVCTQVFDIIECYTLPEKVIFEYLETLIKSSK